MIPYGISYALYIFYFLFIITIFGCLFTKKPFSLLIYLGSATTIFLGFLTILGLQKHNLINIFDLIIIYGITGFLSTLTLVKYFYAIKK